MGKQKPKKRTKTAFVGAYVTLEQRGKLRALATLWGLSANRALQRLIDTAAGKASGEAAHE